MLSKSQARIFFFGGTALFTAIFLALTIDTHRKVPSQTRAANISPAVEAGKKIWEDNNCMGCHTLFGEGAYYAPDLTKTVQNRGADWIRIFIKDPEAMYPGQRKMVKYDFTEQQIDDVIAFLEWCGNVDLNGFPADPPLRAAVSPPAPANAALAAVEVPAMFTEKTCLACHTLLGKGQAGVMLPNTAGEIVPAPALDEVYKGKTKQQLIDWISDPQRVKPGSPMPTLVPAFVSEGEVIRMVDFLFSLEELAKETPPAPVPAADAAAPAPAPAAAPK